ncbi:MAG TPA: DUF559 domain-containing protein [Myxococcaceae bacterium]|nr:DUF559 domain-containing protein [Myxococcaceae bacterium]
MRSDTFALQELERHQHRREQGIPTLTVLVGPPGAAASLWRRWLDSHHRPLCTVRTAGETGLLREWAEALARVRNLEADAADFLGAATGLAPGELPSRLKGKTDHERDVLLQELLPAAPDGDVIVACRCLLQPQVLHNPASPQVVHKSGAALEAVLEATGGDALRALGALHALVPPGSAPAPLLAGSGTEWLAQAARVASRLCAAVPALVIALTVDRTALDTYLLSGESQALAMVREGLLELEAPSPEQLQRSLSALGVRRTEELSGSLSRLAEEGAPAEVLARFGEAAREREASATEPAARDRARSAAERFLHALLEALPSTQGLFELNARLPLGEQTWEVDLLSRGLAIAIEVDGYFHFLEPERYRRDRRKDRALQEHGHLVLRFLADDVVARLEEIRDTISEVISHRREAPRSGPSRGEAAHAGGDTGSASG